MDFMYKFLFFTYFCAAISSAAGQRLEFLEIIKPYGYTGEYHYVTTDDGYILRIDRITSSPLAPNNQDKPVVFLQHGLLSVSDLFVFWRRNSSLGFSLADAGYDVWLGNFRGSTNSRNHTSISPNTKRFWDFNKHHWGAKDLPTMIDYVLNHTNKTQLSYVGHSCGTSSSFILLSEKPEYNKKFNILVTLAPIAYWTQKDTALLKRALNLAIPALQMLLMAPDCAVEVFRAGGGVTKICDGIIADDFCALILNNFVGNPSVPFDDDQAEYVTRYIPAGASLKIINHLRQHMNSGKFTKYDYENKRENREIYGQDEPPAYETSKITAPTALFRSHADVFATERNVAELVATLPNVVSHNVIADPKFTHPDYFFHGQAKAMYIDKVLQLINQYKS